MEEGVITRGMPCEFTGWTPNTNKQEIVIARRFREAFFVPAEEDYIDNLFSREDSFNMGYNQCQKNLAELLNKYFISKTMEFSGENKFHKGFGLPALTGPTAWEKTKFPYKNTLDQNFPAVFNSYLSMSQRFNKLNNPFLIEGGFMQLTQGQRVDGSLERYNYAGRNVYSDMNNMIDFNGTSLFNDAFLIARGAMAFFSVYNNPSAAVVESGSNFEVIKMSRPLLGFQDANGQPIMVDIYHERKRTEILQAEFPNKNIDNRCKIYDVYYMEIHGELFLNPLACGDNTTGIIHLTADETLPYFKTQNALSYVEQL
jgi:hypothetical protein